MIVGLLMVAEENDILERVLATQLEIVDCYWVLDGTVPNMISRVIATNSDKCAGYYVDDDLPRPPYPPTTVCGYRGFIYDKAVEAVGHDHWFLELHGDEVWTFHPDEAIDDHPEADGFIFRLPFYFPREPWKEGVHPLDQLHWHMRPGWPEFRMFKGGPGVAFNPAQHFKTEPYGLTFVVNDDTHTINHYPYRSPNQQRLRAALHELSGFDPDNYRHVTEDDAVYWTDEMIENAHCQHHYELVGEPE
jgi:hypothetical protein